MNLKYDFRFLQTKLNIQHLKQGVATTVALVLLFITGAAPLAEANIWQERQYARLPQTMAPTPPALLPQASQIKSLKTKFPQMKNVPAWLAQFPFQYGTIEKINKIGRAHV